MLRPYRVGVLGIFSTESDRKGVAAAVHIVNLFARLTKTFSAAVEFYILLSTVIRPIYRRFKAEVAWLCGNGLPG